MRKITSLTILFLVFFFNSKSQWIQSGGPLGGNINSLSHSNGNKLWAATDDGLYSSIDHGNSWQHLLPGIKGCTHVLATGDSVMLVFNVFVKDMFMGGNDIYATYSLTSINNGLSWGTSTFVNAGSFPLYNNLSKTGQKYLLNDFSYGSIESTDFGNTWNTPLTAVAGSMISYDAVYRNNTAFQNESNGGFGPTYQCVSFDAKNSWAIIDSNWNNNQYIVSALNSFVYYFYDTTHAKILRRHNVSSVYDTVLTSPITHPKFAGITNQYDTLYVMFSDGASPSHYITYRSKDKGNTWQTMGNYYSNHYSSGLESIGANEMITASSGGLVKYSELTDTATLFNNDIKANLIWKIKSNGSSLYAMSNYSIFRSDDDGTTWTNTNFSTLYNSIQDFDVNHDTIVVIDQSDSLRFSFDNGNTWQASYIPFYLSNTIKLYHGMVFVDSVGSPTYLNKYSTNFGTTWNNLSYQGIISANYHSYCEVGDSLFDFSFDGTNQTRYKFNEITHQFDIAGTTNLPMISNFENITHDHGVWFNSGNSVHWTYSLDGLNWATCNLSSLGTSTYWNPYYSRPVYANGNYYAVYDDTNFVYSHDNGATWQYFPGGSSFTFMNYYNSYDKPELIAHKGVLFSPTFQSSVWRRMDTIRTFIGNVYFDANNNNIKDPGEINLKNQTVAIPNSFANTDANGMFSLYTDQTGDSLKVSLPSPSFSSNPSYRITSSSSLSGYDFGLYEAPNISDLTIDLSNNAPFKPGFDSHIIATITNKGTLNQTSVVTITLNNKVTYLGATPSPTSISGNQYTWNLATLSFNQQALIDILVKTKVSTALGDTIDCTSMVTPATTDLYPNDNSYALNEIVIGSYDPNEKSCLQGAQITTTQLDSNQALEYIVRFQNTGSIATSFITVVDTLSELLNWSTFEVTSSSHPMTYTLEGNGLVKFYFNPINLAPVSVNEPESHGYIKYRIHPKKNIPIGSVIQNTAYILFDFNAAIVTNTTSTTVVIPAIVLDAPDIPHYSNFQDVVLVYPNPTSGNFMIDLTKMNDAKNNKVIIYDQQGKVIKQIALNESTTSIDTDHLSNGIYVGVITNNKGQRVSSFKIQVNK